MFNRFQVSNYFTTTLSNQISLTQSVSGTTTIPLQSVPVVGNGKNFHIIIKPTDSTNRMVLKCFLDSGLVKCNNFDIPFNKTYEDTIQVAIFDVAELFNELYKNTNDFGLVEMAPGLGLNVRIRGGRVTNPVEVDDTINDVTMLLSANSTVYVYYDYLTRAFSNSASEPKGKYICALVVSGNSTITSIADCRSVNINCGTIPPQLTQVQINNLTEVINGTTVFNTDTFFAQQYINGNWYNIPLSAPGGGDVFGPAVTLADEIIIANGTSGKQIKGSGKTFETSITNSSSKVPVSSAVVDYIIQQFAQKTVMGFSDGRDGDVTITTTVTLSADMHYNNLTITSPGILITNGYKIYVKGTLSGDGIIRNNGNGGGVGAGGTIGSDAAGGLGGVVPNAGTLNAGVAGAGGGSGKRALTPGSPGGTGASTNPAYLSVTSSSGGNGGDIGGGVFGAGGPGGVATQGSYYNKILNLTDMLALVINPPSTNSSLVGLWWTMTQYKICGGAGGGGGGGNTSNDNSSGGGGGGGGSSGGMIRISAYIVNFTGTIEALGGNGGNGGNGAGSSINTGGGGGAGGNGGLLYLIYRTISSLWTTNLSGGTGGIGGLGTMGGQNGSNGTAGVSGSQILIQI